MKLIERSNYLQTPTCMRKSKCRKPRNFWDKVIDGHMLYNVNHMIDKLRF